jgi:hypothetical protein
MPRTGVARDPKWPATVSAALADAFMQIKDRRQEEEYLGPAITLEDQTIRFPAEVKDEARLNTLAGLFAADPTMQVENWKVADGVYVTMTAALMQQVTAAGFQHISNCFNVEKAKRDEVQALADAAADDTDVSAIKAIQDWLANSLPVGWPVE